MSYIKASARRFSFSSSVGIVLVLSVSYLLGLSLYYFFSNDLFDVSVKLSAYINGSLLAAIFVFLLISIRLSCFSVLGIVIIPVTDILFGLFSSALMMSIASDDIAGLTLIKTSSVLFAAILCTLSVSASAMNSSMRLYRRLRGDKAFRPDYYKLVFLTVVFIILLIFGFSDY